MKNEKNFIQTIQISLDIAIPSGLDSSDAEKFIEKEVVKFIHEKTELVVMNGYYSAEDMSHAYDIDEVNKIYNN